HRSAASFAAMLLMDKFKHPHSVLNTYIEALTGYAAQDAADYVEQEGCRPLVQATTHSVIMHYILTGEHPPCLGPDKVNVVSSGVGRFIDDKMQIISLDQPAPTIAAALWLSEPSYSDENPRSLTSFDDFCSHFEQRWPNGDTYASAGYLALLLAHAFVDEDHCRLSAIVNIPSAPRWLNLRQHLQAELVVLLKTEDGSIQEMVVTSSALLPGAPPLGYSASSANDVVAWLRHERTGAFCICPSDCGAELIFVLRHDAQY
ncbi:hypothetical protein H0H92_013837, partial [Tricholoma furcatifolium]